MTVRRQAFRPDIQGLRAVAVLLVVLYHAGLPGLTGGYVGVDVFFVISGFLITNHLLTGILGAGRVEFGSFYAKRARRILPASLLVVALTILAAVVWIAPLQLRGVFQDAIATALYVPNMLFAFQDTDYLADTTPSLFQHYWSLGVEEQFYLVWPALLAIGFVLTRKSRRGLFWLLVGVVIASFCLGAFLTSVSQPWAFFSLPTRAWELGVGGILAFAVSSSRARPSLSMARLGTWVGLIALFAIALLYTDDTVYPGIAAAAPVVATGAVIYFGNWRARGDAGTFLSTRVMVFVGTISYSLYLVHWPALVIPEQAGGLDRELPLWLTLVIAAACIPLAWVLYRFIELPAMNWTPLTTSRASRTLLASVTASALIVAVSAGGIYIAGSTPLSSDQAAPAASPIDPPIFTSIVPNNLSPSLRGAASANPSIYSDGCHVDETVTISEGCEFGTNADAPLVALFGDSHAAQWFPALQVLADEGTIRLRVDTKSSCPSVDIPKLDDGVPYVACDRWRTDVIEQLALAEPDIVLLGNYARSSGFVQGTDHDVKWSSGLASTISQLPKASAVFVIADSPMLPFLPAACLSAHLHDAHACGAPRDVAVEERINDLERSAARMAGASYIDLTDFICSPDECDPLVGHTLIYRDSNHLTPQFVTLLAPVLRDELTVE